MPKAAIVLGGSLLAAIVALGPAVAAQVSTQAADAEEGGRIFQNTCANCHGPDGDQIAGINLGRGQFRRELSDQDLVGIIRNGIPGTPMPSSNLSPESAARVVAYLRSMAATATGRTVTGNVSRGQALFEGQGGCRMCHRVSGVGSRLGPDLSDIGRFRRTIDLERSLTSPNDEILGQNRFYRVVEKNGTVTTGRLLNLDTFSVQILDLQENLRSFLKADLRENEFVEKSPMPSYAGKLTASELADVVSYLASLKGKAVR
jgi:putative heme-binding domain-containing protein